MAKHPKNKAHSDEKLRVDKQTPDFVVKRQENVFKTQKSVQKVVITKRLLWNLFKPAYENCHSVRFQETQDTLANIAPLIEYFARDPNFFRRERLVTLAGGQQFRPSFQKGLLIIGGYGNGKTSIMAALELIFRHYRMPMRFTGYTSHDLVTTYERIGADTTYRESSKYQFYQQLTEMKGLYLDDVKKEREASNYGKVNLIRDILEKRYNRKNNRTYITCNYRENDRVCDLEDALMEFGERYGGHIYDRLFEMFNIIEFKGDTFRKYR